jgi:ribokinase
MRKASENGKHVVFNPAPAVKLPEEAFRDMDTLIMNETEASILSGEAELKEKDAMIGLAKKFLQKGVKDAVIITLGGDGLVYATVSGASGHVAARKVKVVDTTAAGDTFVGGYAVERARHIDGDFDYVAALEFANLAASKTVERAGAMAAIPYLKELS